MDILYTNNISYGKREIEIGHRWSYKKVLDSVLHAYNIKERPKNVFLQQGEEIRNLARDVPSRISNHETTLDEQFNYSKRIDLSKEVGIYFKKIPIIFQLSIISIYGHRIMKKILHLDPKVTLNELQNILRKEFGIIDGVKLNFIHQSLTYNPARDNRSLEELDIDPRHVIVIIVDILKNMEEVKKWEFSE